MTYATRSAAVRNRRKGEHTVRYIKHKLDCLVSDGLIVPIHDCTCGSKEPRFTNVWSK